MGNLIHCKLILIESFILIGVLLLLVEGSIRCILGLYIIGCCIIVYLVMKGYIFISILFILSLLSMSIIIFLLQYSTSGIYSGQSIYRNISISQLYLLMIVQIYFNSNSSSNVLLYFVKIHNIDCLPCASIFESNMLVFIFLSLILTLLYLVILCSKTILIAITFASNQLYISYICFMNIFLFLGLAILICYIPLSIRYQTNIYKWYNDVYEVGVGVNMSNSISYLNLGISFYIFIFLFFDFIIHVLLIAYLFLAHTFISFLLISIITTISFSSFLA